MGNTQTYGHYTTLAGLLGIIKTQSVWATNIKFLNDEQEFQHALGLIKEIISTSKITNKDHLYELHKEYTSAITKNLDLLDRYDSDSVFTLSFSEQTDLLSQWRGYCPNNNGYCIVFDAVSVFESTKSSFENCHFVRCIYDTEQKQIRLKKLLNDYWFKYNKLTIKKDKDALLDVLTREVMLLASYFKHPTFEEEKEHRIVILLEYATDNDLKFREGRYSLIPFIELKALHKVIKKIIIGPTADKNLAKRALELLWEKNSGIPSFLSEMKIEFSETPFRSW